jgi:hypothetical protein
VFRDAGCFFISGCLRSKSRILPTDVHAFWAAKTSLYILWLRMPAPLSYKISVILFFVSLHHLIEKYTKFIFNLLVKIISNTKNIHTLKINTYCNIKSISYENKKPTYQKLIYITIF